MHENLHSTTVCEAYGFGHPAVRSYYVCVWVSTPLARSSFATPRQFGQNACGELGLGDTVERHTPTVSQTSRGKDIVYVTAGNELTAVLTNTGEVREQGDG